ncbi:MAG: sn-glycerol-3-phosphate ABC transporter ATP-binding protein UgpC [Lentisphaeria bacterium]|nr:sn-glycerol-3-phosphate ABC transporter ATP-binding protein UgpC [Lentisphaeria bacterium]
MAGVLLKDICKVYDNGVCAVDHLTLDIRDRELMVLVGPSGCGKSTTLRMIAGLEEISSGTVSIGQRIVNNVPPKDRDIAMVFQNYALYPHMNVYENMAFGLRLRKFSKADIDKRVRSAAEILGIQDLLDRKPKVLSGGQRQRVAVGRAIVRKPKVFLFDEPLSNLDAKMRVQMRTEISKLHTRLETTMIFVTHDQTEAMTMGDRICVMKDGVLQQVDTPLNIYDRPANTFVAEFIGTPPMNILRGQIQRRENQLVFKNYNMEIRLPEGWKEAALPFAEKDLLFGIRPEDIGSEISLGGTQQVIKARVEVIEPMGAETYLYLDVPTENGNACIARVDSHKLIKVGETAELPLRFENAHLFDPGSTQILV